MKYFTTDGENALRAMKGYPQKGRITYGSLPTGLHEIRVERKIQTLKKRITTMLASLDNRLPPQLQVKAYYAANVHVSAPFTPFHLVKGRKPFILQFHFGHVGLYKGVKTQTTEWGILNGWVW